jgi:hypothetical protein
MIATAKPASFFPVGVVNVLEQGHGVFIFGLSISIISFSVENRSEWEKRLIVARV